MFWYERDLVDRSRPFNVTREWAKIAEDWKPIRRAITKSPFRDDLQGSIARYCRALDEAEPERSFLKLWSLLEYLTSMIGKDYDTLIRRALNAMPATNLDRHLLYACKQYRNNSVHSGSDSASEINVVQLHRFVSEVLLLGLSYSEFFQSREELGQFLSLPRTKDKLSRQIELRRKALHWHRAK